MSSPTAATTEQPAAAKAEPEKKEETELVPEEEVLEGDWNRPQVTSIENLLRCRFI